MTRMERLYERRGEKQMRVWKIIIATIGVGLGVVVFNLNLVFAPILMLIVSLTGIVISIIMSLLGK